MVELERAQTRLIEAGLINDLQGRLIPVESLRRACVSPSVGLEEVILAIILDLTRPLWLIAATRDGEKLIPELLPDDVAEALSTVFASASKREAFLLERARKVDSEALRELGDWGEELVEESCKENLIALGYPSRAAEVCRVSAISDELGYDITAPRVDGSVRRLEVKATRRNTARLSIVLTRNEISVGLGDPDWYLVVAHVGRDTREVLGWATAEQLSPILPSDTSNDGRWQTARLRLPSALLQPGLPPEVG